MIKTAHKDPDKEIQHNIFNMLVANGLPEDIAAIVVSNIGRMDMRGLWKKLKTKCKEEESPYGWRHSCGESFYQLDSPGDPCPSCGDSGGDWEYYDEDMIKESNVKKIAADKNYKIIKKSFLGFKAPLPPNTQESWSWDEVVRMSKENKAKLYWVRDDGQLWWHDGESENSNVEHARGVCTQTQRRCPDNLIVPPEGSYYETM
tara:strand:- start:9 stop:617 length:609 start_codon:yes stop_codon:yes gene_type:complete